MNLMYLTFGDNLKNHYQANFSILTFLKQKSKIDSITVFTDFPEFYKSLNKEVDIVNIDKEKLNEWEGEHQFFWRVKIKAIQYLITKFGEAPILYLDSDTFLYGNMDKISSLLDANFAIMHENEGNLNKIRYKTERTMWKQVKNNMYGGITITEKHCMWNAGAIVIPANKNSKAISLALQICDDMCAGNVTRRLIEQFSLSVALDETYGLKKITSIIGHYWGNKEDWNQVITNFYIKNNLANLSFEASLLEIDKIDLVKIATRKVVPNTRKRLIKRITKMFPLKETLYANKQ